VFVKGACISQVGLPCGAVGMGPSSAASLGGASSSSSVRLHCQYWPVMPVELRIDHVGRVWRARASWAFVVRGGRAGGKFVGHPSSFFIFDDFPKLVGRILLLLLLLRVYCCYCYITAVTAPPSFEGPAAHPWCPALRRVPEATYESGA